MIPWTVVLKVVPRHSAAGQILPASDDPTHQLYWKRELLLARSDLLERLPNGLRAPTCHGVSEWPDGYWLWLEEIHDRYGKPWPLERFGLAARHLGRLGGTYLTQRPLPTYSWLTRGLLRQRMSGSAGNWDRLPRLLDHPLVRRGFPADVYEGLRRLRAESETFLSALDRLPRTLQHGDAGRKNLLAVAAPHGEDTTLATDWGFLGIGAIGEEIASSGLSPMIWFNGVEPDQLQELDGIAFEGYLRGLRDVGWLGDPGLVRLGYAAALALRFGTIILEPRLLAEGSREQAEKITGHPLDEAIDRWAAMRRFVLARADEARERIEKLPSEERGDVWRLSAR